MQSHFRDEETETQRSNDLLRPIPLALGPPEVSGRAGGGGGGGGGSGGDCGVYSLLGSILSAAFSSHLPFSPVSSSPFFLVFALISSLSSKLKSG